MAYRCPYCHAALAARPPRGVCPSCERTMVLPPDPAKAEERRARRRALDRIEREAERRRMEIGVVPDGRGVHSPRVLLLVVAGFAILGASLVASSRRAAARMRPQPHLRAVHELDAIATALGRFRFHVGRYPRTDEGGLYALVRDDLGREGEGIVPDAEGTPRIAGWIGPYLNVVHPDPWGREYAYEPATSPAAPSGCDAPLPRLFSLGPDGAAGTPDDLFPDPASFDVGTAWTNGWVPGPARLPGAWIGTHGGILPPDQPVEASGAPPAGAGAEPDDAPTGERRAAP